MAVVEGYNDNTNIITIRRKLRLKQELLDGVCEKTESTLILEESIKFTTFKIKVFFNKVPRNFASIRVELFDRKAMKVDGIVKIWLSVQSTSIAKTIIGQSNVGSVNGRSGIRCTASKIGTIEVLKNNPLITIQITLHCGGVNSEIVAPNDALSVEQQQKTLYELSKSNGDITLVIKDEDNIDTLPPCKKRKIDNNQNNINTPLDIGNEIKVSGIILQSASPVFKSILSNNMIEKKERKIIVYAKDVKCVDNMIYFMCTNELRENANSINVFKLANYYQMDRLKYKCINKMIKTIDINNFVDTINLFDNYGIRDGYTKLIEFAKKNVSELKEVSNFDELSHAFKMTVLGLAN